MAAEQTIRIVTRGQNGELRIRDYKHHDAVLKMHTQIGIDDCSTDLSLPKWMKEDHWFAPALLIDHRLVRPAPLSAKTRFVTTSRGETLPLRTLEWQFQEITVRQSVLSHPTASGGR